MRSGTLSGIRAVFYVTLTCCDVDRGLLYATSVFIS
jgi:hypothetical protein